jgi:NTE family protein
MFPGPGKRRVGVVLSAGGLRGAAHLGVLRQLILRHVPIDVLVGVSAGAIIAAYYAGAGLTVNELIGDAPTFRGRHLLMHGLTLRAPRIVREYLRPLCGIIPQRLEQLEQARFDVLHHGVGQLGIVCHDLVTNRPRYFSTDDHAGMTLADVARASAAVPGVFPSKTITFGAETMRLVDGGIGDSLPIEFARSPALGATHLIVSDCRLVASAPPEDSDSLIYIRPELDGLRTLHGPRTALIKAVASGEAAITPAVIKRLEEWSPVPLHV